MLMLKNARFQVKSKYQPWRYQRLRLQKFRVSLSLRLSHIATAMLPRLRYKSISEFLVCGLTDIMKHPLKFPVASHKRERQPVGSSVRAHHAHGNIRRLVEHLERPCGVSLPVGLSHRSHTRAIVRKKRRASCLTGGSPWGSCRNACRIPCRNASDWRNLSGI